MTIPTVTQVIRADGSALGLDSITVQGSNFTVSGAPAVLSVTFGGVNVAPGDWGVVDDTTLAVHKTPPHAAGVVDVDVTTADGTGTLTGGYTYLDPPVVSSCTPATGPTTGGTAVTITGSGFVPGSSVKFGLARAKNIVVVDANTITCTTPARPAGPVAVTVITGPGNLSGLLHNGFLYA